MVRLDHFNRGPRRTNLHHFWCNNLHFGTGIIMANRELVMLAKTYDPNKHQVAGWFVSTKYDGQRCFWDGGISRGRPKRNIPWANQAKDSRYVMEPMATGLWSRYGNVIHAPDWFLDKLPEGVFLDGELWCGRGLFQETRTIISTIRPNHDQWRKVRFLVFESPHPDIIFQSGKINNPNFSKQIVQRDCMEYMPGVYTRRATQFEKTIESLSRMRGFDFQPVEQVMLPSREEEAKKILDQMLEAETALNGEGLMLRHPLSYYEPKRSGFLLKVKKFDTDVATVVGYTDGVGKLSGMLGALEVKFNDKTFKLSGFTEEERLDAKERFPINSTVRFRFRGKTDDGIPREARYFRNFKGG